MNDQQERDEEDLISDLREIDAALARWAEDQLGKYVSVDDIKTKLREAVRLVGKERG